MSKNYIPSEADTVSVDKISENTFKFLKVMRDGLLKEFRENIPSEFSEEEEEKFADLIDKDEWTPDECLKLSAYLFAIGVMQSYESR